MYSRLRGGGSLDLKAPAPRPRPSPPAQLADWPTRLRCAQPIGRGDGERGRKEQTRRGRERRRERSGEGRARSDRVAWEAGRKWKRSRCEGREGRGRRSPATGPEQGGVPAGSRVGAAFFPAACARSSGEVLGRAPGREPQRGGGRAGLGGAVRAGPGRGRPIGRLGFIADRVPATGPSLTEAEVIRAAKERACNSGKEYKEMF
ncbi:PREDICTED: serine/arginine repetitive matrix protein 3-like [Chinchilla lanigera]|uniref:serine/arginine repetitive matrix protein 3-like n=1 Tax=Chinchilla lanigera TaxID=34839 RepID=UPI0006961957|nr:PREDICTED: serine/arginine repetitive matrix protein 3-like [Chinchilla lanigera]